MNFFRNQKILLALKVVLFILMSWFIVNQLFVKNDFASQFRFFIQNFNSKNSYLFILVLLLMPVNWSLEVIKWKRLIKSRSSFINLFKSVIAGITIGFVTPGRGGEFIGRVMFLDEDDKAKVFYLSSIGGIAQTAVTLLMGVFFVRLWRGDSFLSGIVIGLAIAYLLLYFRFDLLNRFILSNPFLEKHSLVIRHEDLPDISTQVNVLLLSFVRFLTYLFQYVLLLIFFGVNNDLFLMAIHSGVFLLTQTFSPLMPLLDISFRGGSALFVFKDFSENNIAVLCAVMSVWVINLVIPSLIGYLFILRKTPLANAIQ